jgi:hypothetical protein
MYIQVTNKEDAPVMISRKLFRAMNFPKGKAPYFIQISQIKGTDKFAIIPRSNEDTFKTQCCMVTLSKSHNKRTPALFHWTIPSLQYFLAVTGIKMVEGKILKVKPLVTPNFTCFQIVND